MPVVDAAGNVDTVCCGEGDGCDCAEVNVETTRLAIAVSRTSANSRMAFVSHSIGRKEKNEVRKRCRVYDAFVVIRWRKAFIQPVVLDLM